MRIRGFLLTSVTAAGLLFVTASNIPSAYAQKGNLMSPSTGWAVNQVAGKATGGGYCAVARRFEGDTILTIARNEGAETSFALDFPSVKFSAKKDLSVTLDPGAGLQREYDVKPLSQKAFVVRLGQDNDFFNALERTGFLRVELGAESYVFNISDIDVGQSGLESCLRDLNKAAAKPVPAADYKKDAGALPAPVIGRGLDAPSDSNVAALRAENLRLQAQLQTGNKSAVVAAKPAPRAQGVNLSALKTQLNDAKAENARLQARIEKIAAQAAKQSAKGETVSVDRAKLKALRAENIQLNARVQNLTQSLEGFQNVDQTQKNWEKERISLRRELQSAQDRKANLEREYEDKVSSLSERNSTLVSSLKQAKVAIGNLAALRENIAGVNDENATLKDKVAALMGQLSQKDAANVAQLEVTQDQLALLRKSLEVETEQKLSAQRDAESLSEELAALKRENAEQVAALSEDLSQSKDKLASLGALKAANADLQAQLLAFSQKVESKQEQVQISQAEIEAKNEALTVALGEKDAKAAALALELDAKAAEIAALSAVQDHVKDVEARNAALEEQVVALQGSLEDAQRFAENKTVNAAEQDLVLSALRDENAAFKSQVQQQNIQISELSSAKDALEALSTQHASLKNDLSSLESVLASTQGALEAEKAQNVETQLLLAALQDENKSLFESVELAAADDAAAAKVAAQNSELRDVLAMTVEKIEDLNGVVQEQSITLASVEKNNAALNDQLEFASSLIEGKSQSAFLEEQRGLNSDAANKVEPKPEPVRVASIAPKIKPAPVKKPSVVKSVVESVQTSVSDVRAAVVANVSAEDLANIAPAAGGGGEATVVAQNKIESIVAQTVAPEASDDNKAAAQDFMDRNLSEAQIYEEQLKRRLKHEVLVTDKPPEKVTLKPVSKPEIKPQVQDASEIIVRKSEDPFESIGVQKAPDSFDAKAQEATEKASKAVSNTSVDNAREAVLSQADRGLVPVKDAVSSAASINVPQGQALENVASLSPIATLLGAANITAPQNVKTVAAASGPDITAYQWRAGDAYGSGEQKALPNEAAFEGFVQEYLSRTEQRCQGDFAIVPDNSRQQGSMRIDSYEVACIGGGINSGASLVFYNDGGVFNVVAHEVDANNMDQAMRLRDQVFATLKDGSRS